MAIPCEVEVIEHCQVAPPLNSVPTTSIPITFFDIPLLLSSPVQHILFYEFHHPNHTLHFTQTILPKLKHSLSLTLQHFFPLAGTFVCPPQPTQPYILYKDDGNSSVPLIIAESKANFDHLVKNYPRDEREFHPLVPKLSPPSSDTGIQGQGTVKLLQPLMALQVTIFPNNGISIAYSYRHVVGDGRSIYHFIKSWASVFKSNEELSAMSLPSHDRTAMTKEPKGIFTIMWNQLHESGISWEKAAAATTAPPPEQLLIATFVLGNREINGLRHWITSHFVTNDEPSPTPTPTPQFYISRFVVTCAFIWRCLIKSENATNSKNNNNNNLLCHFQFFADSRERNNDFYVPKTFFGNCITPFIASVKRSELLSENGLNVAAKSIMNKVQELDSGSLRGPERWFPEDIEIIKSGMVTVSGSPKFRIYDTDFGWGRPKKSEKVHIVKSPSISLSEDKDEEGGIEVGLALNKVGMDAFISIFEHDLQDFMLKSNSKNG